MEGKSFSLHAIQSVKAPNTHLYDNFLFTMSKDSNTDTIHFPFINWRRNVALHRSDLWSLLGLKVARVCLTGSGSRQQAGDS